MTSQYFVDLLEDPARLRVQSAGLRQSLTFAFSAGGNQAELARALSEAKPGASLWSQDCFADDLFLAPLLERCLWRGRGAPRSSASAGVRRYLLGVLSSPPRGPRALEVVAFRQAITAELDRDPQQSERVQRFVARIEALFELLEAGGAGMRLDPIRRGLDVLGGILGIVDEAIGFESSSSGLVRIASWAKAVRASAGYGRVQALLDYDGHAATVQVSLQLGREGDVRSLDVVRILDNSTSPFHVSPWRRFYNRLALALRGYRVRREEVFGRLVHDTFDAVIDVFPALLQLLGDLEFYRLGGAL